MPLPSSLISFEYVVQNIMLDPEDEQTVHWMGLETPDAAAWQENRRITESKDLRLR
jgi:hypothetical protein